MSELLPAAADVVFQIPAGATDPFPEGDATRRNFHTLEPDKVRKMARDDSVYLVCHGLSKVVLSV